MSLTSTGYTATRAAAYLTTIRDDYEARLSALGLNNNISWDRDVFLSQITAIMAAQLGELGEATQAIYDAWTINNAVGLQLDNLAAIVGVTRTPATYSTVTLTLTTSAPVPAGSIVQGGGTDGKAKWKTTADATPASGSATVVAQALESGEVAGPTGEITTIVTPVDGWTLVNNAADASVGVARETDAALRKRRQQALQQAGAASINAIRSALLDLDFITAASVIENDTGSTTSVDGISMPPHSVAIIVFPTTLTDAQKATVAETIYNKTPAGIETVDTNSGNEVEATVTSGDGFSKTIFFDVASSLAVDVVVTTTLAAGYVVADVEVAVQTAVADYFSTLTVGSDVRILAILGLISVIDGIVGASITLNAGSVDITTTAIQIATLNTPVSVP